MGTKKGIGFVIFVVIMATLTGEYVQIDLRIKAIFYNVWSPHGIYYAGKFEIRVIPTVVILDQEGTEYFRHEGFLSKEKLI